MRYFSCFFLLLSLLSVPLLGHQRVTSLDENDCPAKKKLFCDSSVSMVELVFRNVLQSLVVVVSCSPIISISHRVRLSCARTLHASKKGLKAFWSLKHRSEPCSTPSCSSMLLFYAMKRRRRKIAHDRVSHGMTWIAKAIFIHMYERAQRERTNGWEGSRRGKTCIKWWSRSEK